MKATKTTGAVMPIFAMVAAFAGAVACGAPPSGEGNIEEGRRASPDGANVPAAPVMGALDMTAVHEAEERAVAERPASPSIRKPFVGGYFETRNKEFPFEVEQAMAGKRTEHTVIVWAAPRPVAPR